MKTLKVALLGCGNVGAQVARILLEDASELAARAGAKLELSGIAVRNIEAKRDVELPRELFTTDALALIADADVVIELLGGMEPAGELISAALASGASVVTGNKALLAVRGAELGALAAANGAQLRYEAAVAGAIPILRPITDSLSGDRITKVMGIVNGTTNFILDAMDTTGAQFADVLAEAQALGYAEADPTADVEGHDAAAKAAILASLAFHTDFDLADVHCEGISRCRRLTSQQQRTQAWSSSCWPSPNALKRGSRCACTRPCCPASTRWHQYTARITPCSSRPKTPAS